MNVRDLQYLVAVADLKNFTKAADKCNISQPTLSGQIKKLEDIWGVPVFERTNKRVMVTETGEVIVAAARRILQEVKAIDDIAAHARDPLAGNFRLGAFPTLASYILPPLVPKIRRSLPKLKLLLLEEKTANLITALKNGKLDAALLALPIAEEGLSYISLFKDAFYLAVPKADPLARKKRVSLQDIMDQKLLLLEEGHCLRDQALSVCHMAGTAEDEAFRATSLETLRQMVKAGTGITLMPAIAAKKEEAGIAYIPFKNPAPSREIGLFYRSTSPRKAVIEKVAAFLK